MQVRKRNGSLEPVNLDKILKSITKVSTNLPDVEPMLVARKVVSGLVDGVTTRELDILSISTASNLILQDPGYGLIASRIMSNVIAKEVEGQEIQSFSQCIQTGFDLGLISEATHKLVMANKRKLNASIKPERDLNFEYHGIQTVYDRYLLRHRTTTVSPTSKERVVIETPQYFFMRVACGLANDAVEAVEMYDLLSSLEYMTSTPTLFNSGTVHSQMSSCYLLDSPLDDLHDIYKRYTDIASLSKFAGGIGVSMSRVRSSGSLIRGTNGKSNGVVPWLNTLSASVNSVNQGGKRKGAACVYLETWHPDVMSFLEMRDQTGAVEARTRVLNLANWIPDEFMRRVEADEMWSFIDPAIGTDLPDLYGDEFTARYRELEAEGKIVASVPARKIFARMMKTLSETGNGWMCWKDTSNKRGNQVGKGRTIKLSNLCTEILEVVSSGKRVLKSRDEIAEMSANDMIEKNLRITGFDAGSDKFIAIEGAECAVCNLGSINLGRGYVKNGKLDKAKLKKNVVIAVKYLDRVIDRNFYPIQEARSSNMRWRPVGLGLMGLADFFFQLRIPFESEEAVRLSAEIAEEIYFHALSTSVALAKQYGPHRDFELTRAAQGQLQFDLAGVEVKDIARWDALRQEIMSVGLRNSLLIAIAPTATISHICGAEECIEPIKTNLFKRETLSGEFVAVNKHLVEDLKRIKRWDEASMNALVTSEGSVTAIPGLPEELYALYKTVLEMKMRSIINHAAARGAFIDQSASTNLFVDINKVDPEKRIATLSSMYLYAWKSKLKTTYYLRGRSATKIRQTTTSSSAPVATPVAPENPEICESCT